MKYIYLDEYGRILCDSNDFIYVSGPLLLTDVYYGISSNLRINESIITSSFSKGIGNVGTIDGRLYSFPTGYSYKYWCIPDINDGEKIINQIINNSKNIILAYDSYYKYYQLNPEPTNKQSITYGKINIEGNAYRIYRTLAKTVNTEFYVYSF